MWPHIQLNFCLDNLFVSDNVHTDYVSTLVAVCTADCAYKLSFLHYITYGFQ